MMRILKSLAAIALASLGVLGAVIPVHADAPNTDIVLKGGYVGKLVGRTWDGRGIYQTDFGAPTYLPDLVTKIDPTWTADNFGGFQAGPNLMTADVFGEAVSIGDKKGSYITWLPSANVSGLDKSKDKSGITADGKLTVKVKAKILAKDPWNANYSNNVLEWDYGNGILRRLRVIEGVASEYWIIANPIGADFAIETGMTISGNFSGTIGAVGAWDSDGKPIDLLSDKNTFVLTKDKALDAKLKYPITIDPDTTFTTSSSDGNLSAGTTNWATTRDATTGTINNTGFAIALWVRRITGNYYVYRPCLYYDTSGLSGFTVTSANLSLYMTDKWNQVSAAWTLQITNGQPTYPHDPMVAGDYNQTHYSGVGGTYAYADLPAANNRFYVSFNGTGLSWINTSGTTKLMLREKEHDSDNVTPTVDGINGIQFAAYEYGASWRPQLNVTYTAGSVGIVATAASNVAYTSARLNSSLTSDGGDNVSVRWGFGTTSHTSANFTGYDNVTDWTGYIYQTGNTPYLDATGLTNATTYYYRVQAKNSSSNATSTDEITFTTSNAVSNISKFFATPTDDSLSLGWVFGTGDTNALIMYRTDAFSANITDGTQVYFGTATSYNWQGLLSGQTYYMTAWGESGGTYSSNGTQLAMTTGLAAAGGDSLETPSVPSEWNQPIDPSGFAGLGPIYTTINNFIQAWGVPASSGWAGVWLIAASLIGMGIWLKTDKLFLGAMVVTLLMLGGVMFHVATIQPLLVMVFVDLGVYAIERQNP